MTGYLRKDGRKGIRNLVVVAYLVECAHHVSREIVTPYREEGVHLIGFPGCYPNQYAAQMMNRLCTHPNVGAVLLVSLGCESFHRAALQKQIADSGRPVHLLVIQETGGTRKTIAEGRAWVEGAMEEIKNVPKVPMDLSELVVGTICGGSDATSGLTANPVIGDCFDRLVDAGATCIFEETGELIGCEHHMASRAINKTLGEELIKSVAKAEVYYTTLGHGSFAPGNAAGGLTTQEEKSLGAYAKSGTRPISGLIKPTDIPPKNGLYLLDVVPDGDVRFGFPNINDNAEAAELIACGAHLILFSTGRGSVVGSAISPIVKICANPETYARMEDDMDINAGKILTGTQSRRVGAAHDPNDAKNDVGYAHPTISSVGEDTFNYVQSIAMGALSKSESLGHQEFILGYKRFEPTGPGCLPVVR